MVDYYGSRPQIAPVSFNYYTSHRHKVLVLFDALSLEGSKPFNPPSSSERLSSKKATAAQHHQLLGLIYGCGESLVFVPVLWPQVPELTVRLELN